jgi:hypothetical protein
MAKETIKEAKKLDIDKFNQDLVKHQQDLISLLEKELKCKLSLETLKLQPINNSNEYGIWIKLKVLSPGGLYSYAIKDSWLLSILTFNQEYKCYMDTPILDYVARIGDTSYCNLASSKDDTKIYLLYYPGVGTWKLVSRKQLEEGGGGT